MRGVRIPSVLALVALVACAPARALTHGVHVHHSKALQITLEQGPETSILAGWVPNYARRDSKFLVVDKDHFEAGGGRFGVQRTYWMAYRWQADLPHAFVAASAGPDYMATITPRYGSHWQAQFAFSAGLGPKDMRFVLTFRHISDAGLGPGVDYGDDWITLGVQARIP